MKILIVDDERNIRESIVRLLAIEGIDAEEAADGAQALELLRAQAFDAVVTDLRMPAMGGQELLERAREEGLRCPVIMISAFGEINDAVAALKAGAVDYLIKPFDPDELIHKIRAAVSSRRLEDRLEAGSRTASPGRLFIGESAAARDLLRMIEKIARADTTVLITGESGAGKEVVAREIHERSPRSEEPFVAVNIGAVHDTLMESELFGHEKGAFTGADSRKTGLFELAGSGSLFLDEIGEMPLPLQVKLLRVIQERKIRRLGGTRDIPVAARILSATNRDIEALVGEGRFREDLYYRLNVLRVAVPPLRERSEDIPLMAGFLLRKICDRMGRPPARLGAEAIEVLSAYSFPGNVRELENILERALIYVEGDEILPSDLDIGRGPRSAATEPGPAASPPSAPVPTEAGGSSRGLDAAGGPAAAPGAGPGARGASSLDSVEREAIERALAKWGGNRTRAAEELGISRRTILNKIKRYGL